MREKIVPIYGSVVTSTTKPQELYKCKPMTAKVNGKLVTKINAASSGFSAPVDISWLKACSTVYNISPDINDYIVVNVPALTSDIPNRNSQAFPLSALVDFDPEVGRVRYKTFIGKPTHIEHMNKILDKAKGVILDANLEAVPQYGVAKVNLLMAFCRQKDPNLCADIYNGKRNGYSMGAMASTFRCSVCGGICGPNVKRTCTCYPSDFNRLDLLGNVINGRLHYLMALDMDFIECSSVASPADVTAIGALM